MEQRGFTGLFILLGVLILSSAGIGSYYYLHQKNITVTQPSAKSSASVLATPTATLTSTPTPAIDQAVTVFDRIRKTESDIEWSSIESTSEAIPTYGQLSGQKMTGRITINDLNNEGRRVVDFDAIAKEKGWIDDINQAADGMGDSLSGYKKNDAGKLRVFNIHKSFLDQARFMAAREAQKEEKCPCHYQVEIFVSDPFSAQQQ